MDFCNRGIFLLALVWLLGAGNAIAGKWMFVHTDSNTTLSKPDSLRNPGKLDKFLAADKAKHFTASLLASVFFYKIAEDRMDIAQPEGKIYSFSLTIGLGLAKEFYDRSRPGNYFSWKDLLADAVGIAAGFVLINQP